MTLLKAAAEGSMSRCRQLLASGCDAGEVNSNGVTPLLMASFFGHSDVCQLFLDNGELNLEERDPLGNTALMLAATTGRESTVGLLLSRGARVEMKNKKGVTPLLAALGKGKTRVCKLLLKTGKADLKATTPDGFTPLLLAIDSGQIEACELLLAAGSDVGEKKPGTLSTPLHLAALFGHEKIIKLLLSYKADVNSRNKVEQTPLHLASSEGHLASVVTLLQAGADPLLPQVDGGLPIHNAAQWNRSEVVRILIEQGGCSPDQVRHTALQSFDHDHPHHLLAA